MSSTPLVSVIIPAYNRKDLIQFTLESVRTSTLRDMEILVMDDGSTDGTMEAVQEAALKDGRIQAVALEHGGVSKARNAGIDHARGKYVYFMDSDDLIHPRLLETQAEMLEARKADAVMTTLNRFTEEPPVWEEKEVPEIWSMDAEKAKWSFFTEHRLFKQTAGMMVLREHVKDECFDTDLEFGKDTLFTYRLIRKGLSWGYIMNGWYAYRKHASSLTLRPTEHGVWSRIEAMQRMLALERAEGPTPGSSYLLSTMCTILKDMEVKSKNDPKVKEAIRLWIKDKKERGIFREASLISRLTLSFSLCPSILKVPRDFLLRVIGHFYYATPSIVRPDLPPKDQCMGCGACQGACHQNALKMRPGRDGFFYPEVTPGVCTHCGACLKVCPVLHPDVTVEPKNRFYGARARDEAILKGSSSGGLFPLLASEVISKDGVVIAAGFDQDMSVRHQVIERKEDLDRVLRTKYVQSRMEDATACIREAFASGREVLFVGTPCQTHAMRLRFKNHERLTLCSLVCYGVPSPGVWKDYVRYLEKRHGGRMEKYDFRDKRAADDGHTVSYVIGGKEYAHPLSVDLYSILYFRRLIIRKSCHSCPFATARRDSDITLGDFWAAEKVRKNFDGDGMGLSLCITHTPKGEALFQDIVSQTEHLSCQEEDCLQPRLIEPTPKGPHRDLFFFLYRRLPFRTLLLMGRPQKSR